MENSAKLESLKFAARRLRLIRVAYGRVHGCKGELSQAAIAKLCGINRQAWNNAETGNVELGKESAIKLRQITGATLDYIFVGEKGAMPMRLLKEIEHLEGE